MGFPFGGALLAKDLAKSEQGPKTIKPRSCPLQTTNLPSGSYYPATAIDISRATPRAGIKYIARGENQTTFFLWGWLQRGCPQYCMAWGTGRGSISQLVPNITLFFSKRCRWWLNHYMENIRKIMEGKLHRKTECLVPRRQNWSNKGQAFNSSHFGVCWIDARPLEHTKTNFKLIQLPSHFDYRSRSPVSKCVKILHM